MSMGSPALEIRRLFSLAKLDENAWFRLFDYFQNHIVSRASRSSSLPNLSNFRLGPDSGHTLGVDLLSSVWHPPFPKGFFVQGDTTILPEPHSAERIVWGIAEKPEWQIWNIPLFVQKHHSLRPYKAVGLKLVFTTEKFSEFIGHSLMVERRSSLMGMWSDLHNVHKRWQASREASVEDGRKLVEQVSFITEMLMAREV